MADLQDIKLLVSTLKSLGIGSQKEIGRLVGYNNESAFSQVLNGKSPIPKGLIDKLRSLDPRAEKIISQSLPKENKKTPRLEAKPIDLASDPNDFDDDGAQFEHSESGIIRMRVPIIPHKAQAGYLRGFQDPEYYEKFKTVSFDVLKEHRGHYLSFEVVGDSMITTDPDLFEYMALPGWKAIGCEVPRHHWKNKLHTHKRDTWIVVHETEGILIKQIVDQDLEKSTITIHSLNPKYEDETFSLNDIAQIFSVVKYVIDK